MKLRCLCRADARRKLGCFLVVVDLLEAGSTPISPAPVEDDAGAADADADADSIAPLCDACAAQ
jgi:hypothetical protein